MLELKSLDAAHGSFQALFGVNLDVKAGEAVGVIGPNGPAGQDHADARDLRPDPADARHHRHGGHRCRGDAGAPHRRPRHRPRP